MVEVLRNRNCGVKIIIAILTSYSSNIEFIFADNLDLASAKLKSSAFNIDKAIEDVVERMS